MLSIAFRNESGSGGVSAAGPSEAYYSARVVTSGDAEAVLLASRALVAVAAKSLSQVEDVVTAMQWRVLVVVSRQPLALHELAAALGVHPSTGTRLCDQLVTKKLLSREDHPADRRYLVIKLTAEGERLVSLVNQERQRDISTILGRLSKPDRRHLVEAMTKFAQAAGELTSDPLWDLGGTSSEGRRPLP